MFGQELIRINAFIDLLIKTVRSAVSKNCAERGIFFCGVSHEILKTSR